jgi:hypothetical protein
MSRIAPSAGLGLLLAGAALAQACGPSLTTVHEGTVRFEHCYRLDLEAGVNAQQRTACWTHWLNSYTYGQSRDRIDYARRRLDAIADSNRESPELRLAGEQRSEQRQFYLVVPAPSSVHATPPPIATAYQPAADANRADAGTSAAESANTPPADACAASCKSSWQSCDKTCSVDPATPKRPAPPCTCKDDYSTCMRRCFE